jgi:putative transferase (TIGR04331 family)
MYFEKLKTSYTTYHWSDSEKRSDDYFFLKEKYDSFIKILSSTLNEVHNVSENIRHWEIIYGYWALCYLSIIFDRKELLNLKFSDNFLPIKKKGLDIPANTRDFVMKAATSDDWNEQFLLLISQAKVSNDFNTSESVYKLNSYNFNLYENFLIFFN